MCRPYRLPIATTCRHRRVDQILLTLEATGMTSCLNMLSGKRKWVVPVGYDLRIRFPLVISGLGLLCSSSISLSQDPSPPSSPVFNLTLNTSSLTPPTPFLVRSRCDFLTSIRKSPSPVLVPQLIFCDSKIQYEDVEELITLSPEKILLKWMNFHFKKAGYTKTVTNFSADIKVSTYALLVEDVLEVVSNTVVVHEAAASRIQRLTKGFWGG
ncbi:unnamed protein product [Lactuca saligna]|uniref:Calponin-homology (CH) domain-containing protein n=1 Tax=Lactuca saligna TaxID=75948 RepID=A0AA35VSG5_LACSI|nr:unnamed protein product [Lactuca saligna]